MNRFTEIDTDTAGADATGAAADVLRSIVIKMTGWQSRGCHLAVSRSIG